MCDDILVEVENEVCALYGEKKSEQAEGQLKVGFKLEPQTIQHDRVNPVRGVSAIPLVILASSNFAIKA